MKPKHYGVSFIELVKLELFFMNLCLFLHSELLRYGGEVWEAKS